MKSKDQIMIEDLMSEAADKHQELGTLAKRDTSELTLGAAAFGAITGTACAAAVLRPMLSEAARAKPGVGYWASLLGGTALGGTIAALTARAATNEVRAAAKEAAMRVDQNHLERLIRQRAEYDMQGQEPVTINSR